MDFTLRQHCKNINCSNYLVAQETNIGTHFQYYSTNRTVFPLFNSTHTLLTALSHSGLITVQGEEGLTL